MNKKISLITGSSKGMGRGIAQKFYENGYFVYISYLSDKDGAEETATNMDKERYDIVKLDVRKEEDVKNVMNKIKEKFGKLDVLVNNAGIEIPETIEEATLKNWNTVIQTKINGVFLCSKYAKPLLEKSSNPNIINISSSLGQNPSHKFPAYCTATAGVDALTKILATGFAKYKIRTNSVAPGTTPTPMMDFMDDKGWERVKELNPLKKLCKPEFVADTILKIVEDENKYLNGNTVFVNGGVHLT